MSASSPGAPHGAPRAVVFGCAGPRLTAEERRFFAEADPLGFILFARNVENPDQVRALVGALRETVGRADAPVLIDQEGGRVARLKPPHWAALPPAGRIAALDTADPEAAAEAAWLQGRIIAAQLQPLGITVDCAPVLDLRLEGAHDIVGDRAFGTSAPQVIRLGRAFCRGMLEGGVLPVVKHIPGHGRALCDSHSELPRVEAALEELEETDFEPFRALAEMPWAMTAHILYQALDPERPATTSRKVIEETIRGRIAFRGVLVSDDLSMEALEGDLGARAEACLAAGCDVALHCNGDPKEMAAVAERCGPLTQEAQRRLKEAAGQAAEVPGPAEEETLLARLEALLDQGPPAP